MASTWALQKALPPEDPNVVERALGDGRVQIGAYEVLEVIGEGEFASVWEARSAARPGERLAMKAIKKARVGAKRNIARVDREVAALQRLRHAGVCRLYGVVHSPTYVYLVMEAGDRDLFAFLDGYPRGCDDGTVCAVMRILALALRHCHNAGVAHRDVKPENVLVVGDPATWGDAEGVVKLCDFGLCADVAGDPRLTDFVGSPGFFAPELMTAESYCGRGADAWSLGAVLVELLLGHRAFEAAWCPPYEELNDPEKFLDGVRRAAARVKLGAAAGPPSEPMAALLEQLVQIDPARRATVADVCGAPVFGLLRDSQRRATGVFFRVNFARRCEEIRPRRTW
ncbi:hypothetical protein AURANDRAFT_20231 [Aureococcus anophagefferens]|uniref:Protein kinase domain-containing protein n=1 Tax=Aureococcus anophagefferens TaxID=44056 RepID=F0XYN3_AURAN|nr:hypothetical protein AURANDRAFT_20231 [Aureococcus anophagefferens]EGB12489.1 hypothetical protein AURANDRAFT_20231 [Aureococcus anophagefferens]|eukprot:XP_009033512.1 hypothetical protein AURANDRAFT_20231 [Aureococcus anophagefferens]